MSLSERIRPNCEAAPWVIEEVKKLEARNTALENEILSIGAKPPFGQVNSYAQERAKEIQFEREAAELVKLRERLASIERGLCDLIEGRRIVVPKTEEHARAMISVASQALPKGSLPIERDLAAARLALVDYVKEAKCSRFATGSDDDGTDARHGAAVDAARAAVAAAEKEGAKS